MLLTIAIILLLMLIWAVRLSVTIRLIRTRNRTLAQLVRAHAEYETKMGRMTHDQQAYLKLLAKELEDVFRA